MAIASWLHRCASISALAALSVSASQIIQPSSSLIFFHGRWDSLPSSWWPSSGFKLSFTSVPSSLVVNVGSSASSPPIVVGVRFGDAGEHTTLNLTAGANALPLVTLLPPTVRFPLVFDLVTQFEQGQARLELLSLDLDDSATLAEYSPKKIVLEFIGDSLTAGYENPRGSLDDYAFKVGEAFGTEHNQIAQSGICLVSLPAGCYGNNLGMDQQYFKTENSAAQYLNANGPTTWNFSKYGKDTPTHVIIALGTNDQSNGVTSAQFQSTYTSFLKNLRTVYKTQPIFAMSPWGWPYDGGVAPYWQDETSAAVTESGDPNVHLMNGLGWLPYAANNVNYYADGHPTPTGHSIIAGRMIDWLSAWGLNSTSTTTTGSPSSTITTATSTVTKTSSATTVTDVCDLPKYSQCGGMGFQGCKICTAGSTCKFMNDWYSQCL